MKHVIEHKGRRFTITRDGPVAHDRNDKGKCLALAQMFDGGRWLAGGKSGEWGAWKPTEIGDSAEGVLLGFLKIRGKTVLEGGQLSLDI